MGFTQRQAAGKFTRDEAAALIDQLEEAEHVASCADSTGPEPAPSASEQALRETPSGQLATELQRRGWIVIEP